MRDSGIRSGTDPPRCRSAHAVPTARSGTAPLVTGASTVTAEGPAAAGQGVPGEDRPHRQALTTVRPVDHVLDDGDIAVRTAGAALTSHARQRDAQRAVVAHEAGPNARDTHLG